VATPTAAEPVSGLRQREVPRAVGKSDRPGAAMEVGRDLDITSRHHRHAEKHVVHAVIAFVHRKQNASVGAASRGRWSCAELNPNRQGGCVTHPAVQWNVRASGEESLPSLTMTRLAGQ